MQRTQLSIEFAGSQLLYVIKSGEHIVSLLCAVDNIGGILLLLTVMALLLEQIRQCNFSCTLLWNIMKPSAEH